MKKIYLIFLGLLLLVVTVLCISAQSKVPHAYYTAATDRITVVDGNESVPCTMGMVYAADIAGGWGQVTKQDGVQYRIDAVFYVGNSTSANTTYFRSINETIIMEKEFRVTTYAYARFGDWGKNGQHSSNGSYVRFNATITSTTYYYVYGNLTVYGSIFDVRCHSYLILRTETGSMSRYNESKFGGFGRLRFYNTNSMVYDSQLTDSSEGWSPMVVSSYPWFKVNSENQIFTNAANRVVIWYANIYGVTVGQRYAIAHSGTACMELINPLVLTPGTYGLCYIAATAGDDHYIRFNYTIDLRVTNYSGVNISGAWVQIWNASGVRVYNGTTNANGLIPQTMLPFMRCYHPNALGNPRINETYNPYKIRISKAGYNTYNESFTANYPINWTIALQNGTSSTTTYIPLGSGNDRRTVFLTIGVLSGVALGMVLPLRRHRNRRKR